MATDIVTDFEARARQLELALWRLVGACEAGGLADTAACQVAMDLLMCPMPKKTKGDDDDA